MRRAVLRKMALSLTSVVAIRLLLDTIYHVGLSKYFAYMGFHTQVDPAGYTVSWFSMLVVFGGAMSLRDSLASRVTLFLLLISFLPLTSYIGMSGEDIRWLLYVTLFWLVMIVSVSQKLRIRVPVISKSWLPSLMVAGAVSLAGILLSFLAFGFNLSFSLDDVYEVRAAHTLSSIPLGGYVVPWASKVALPFILVAGTQIGGVRGKLLSLSAALGLIYLYGVTGHKSIIAIIPLMYLSVMALKSQRFLSYAILGMIFLLAAAVIEVLVFRETQITGLGPRRALFVPAQLSFYYYELFSSPLYLSHSILRVFIGYPHELNPAQLVGLYYFGNSSMSANTGLTADGYMNFGILGVILWAVILGQVLNFFECLAESRRSILVASLLFVVLWSLVNSALLTTFLTHGLLFLVFLLLMSPFKSRDHQVSHNVSVAIRQNTPDS